MTGLLSFEALGYRDVEGRFAQRTKVLQTGKRNMARRIGRLAVERLQANAPRDTGVFAEGIRYATFDRGFETRITIYASGEHAFLLPMILGGTRAHTIPKGGSAAQMAKGYPLSFHWENGPRGPGRYAYWSVEHPGTEPNPFVDETLAEIQDDIQDELNLVAREVAWL